MDKLNKFDKFDKLWLLLDIASESYNDNPRENLSDYYSFLLKKTFDKYNNQYCIYTDNDHTELIIGICGSDSFFDALIDLYIKPYKLYKSKLVNKKCKELFTTSGINIMYNLFKDFVMKDIKEYLESSNTEYNITKISLCGHSLGGSLCVMLLLDLLDDINILEKIKSKPIQINLLTYNSPKFFATKDADNKYNQPNHFINELIELHKLTNQINIINMIYNNKAPNKLSYDHDYDLISTLPRNNYIFKHIADKDNNMYLINAKNNKIEKVQIYNTNSDADEDKPIGILNTVNHYLYYILSLPFKYSDYLRFHKISTIKEYFSNKENFNNFKKNTNTDVLPDNL